MSLPFLQWVLIAHAASTAAMVGLIWFVQIVHYPLFAAVGDGALSDYEIEHARRTSIVVIPPMLVELATALYLAVATPSPAAWLALFLLAVIWASTAFLQVPLHRRLGQSGRPRDVARLVRTNWIRTVAWSLRLPLAAGILLA